MKKNGFTLAEVLITLSIIGVVAALTLPSLMTNTGEQQYKTALKKGLNTLSEAGQMNMALDGFDYSGVRTTSDGTVRNNNGVLQQSLYALLAARTNMDTTASSVSAAGPGDASTYAATVAFRDGSAIYFNPTVGGQNGNAAGASFNVIFDANGVRNPNILSTCTANTVEACNNRNSRDIHDQFLITLDGANAIPCVNTVDGDDDELDPETQQPTGNKVQVVSPNCKASQWAFRF